MDITELVNTTTAAKLAGVARCTISAWKARGLLAPVHGSPDHIPLYRPIDVFAAKAKAQQNQIRTRKITESPGEPDSARAA